MNFWDAILGSSWWETRGIEEERYENIGRTEREVLRKNELSTVYQVYSWCTILTYIYRNNACCWHSLRCGKITWKISMGDDKEYFNDGKESQ